MNILEFIQKLLSFFKRKDEVKSLPQPQAIVHKPVEPQDVWVLAVDGGGIKGLISAYVIEELDKTLKSKNGDAPLSSYFDLIAGTSTGGLITLCLTKTNPISTNDITGLYLHKNGIFFPHPKSFFERLLKDKYSIDGMLKYFDEVFKDDTFNSLTTNALLMSYDIENSTPFPMDKTSTPCMKLKDAAMATTAAPTYYPPFTLKTDDKKYCLIDGGVIANNPTLWAYAKAKELYPNRKRIHVISIGNFRKKPTFNQDSGSFSWLDFSKGNLPIQTLYHSASYENISALAKVFPDLDYIRIEYHNNKEESIKMDDISPLTLNRLTMMGKAVINENKSLITNLADRLISYKKSKIV